MDFQPPPQARPVPRPVTPVAAAPRPAPRPVSKEPPDGYRFKVIVPPPEELGIVLPE